MDTIAGVPSIMIMEPLTVDLRSSVPSYIQVADQLRARIESGEIGPDEPLPSLARMVQETGLNIKTVQRAVRLLADEGIVYIAPGRGTFVSPRQA